MHSINKFFLSIALLPKALYQRMGVNPLHLKAILTAKLIMDDRRPNTLQQTQQRKKNKPVNAATMGTILMSAVVGLVYLVSFTIGRNNVTHLTFYFSFFFFMLAASLISDFTAVLIDVRDNYIILPKPVSGQTVVTARILHIFIHMCKLVVPMALPGLVYMIINFGALGGLYFLLMVLQLTLFVIFFINALYIIILRITTPAKFQSIISYVQILFAIALYASYQVLPRMAAQLGTFSFDATAHPGLFMLPMYWFASGWNTLFTLHAGAVDVLLLLLCFAVPAASLYVVIKYLAPAFNNKLALLNSTGADTQKPAVKQAKTRTSYAAALSRWATKAGAERMGFLFTWKMTARSRDFKVKVYPAVGYLLVIVVMLFVRSRETINFRELNDQQARVIVMTAVYVSSFLMITAITQMSQSENFKAAWIYFIAPLQKPGEVITGALKAMLFKFYMPAMVFILLGGLYFIGLSVLPNLVLGFCNQWLITTLIVYGNNKTFPFSLQQNNNARSGVFLKNLVLMSASGIIGFCHYLVYPITGIVVIFILLSALATGLMISSLKDTSWQKIKSAYA